MTTKSVRAKHRLPGKSSSSVAAPVAGAVVFAAVLALALIGMPVVYLVYAWAGR